MNAHSPRPDSVDREGTSPTTRVRTLAPVVLFLAAAITTWLAIQGSATASRLIGGDPYVQPSAAWFAFVLPVLATLVFGATAFGLRRSQIWAWYVAAGLAGVAGLVAVLGIVAGVQAPIDALFGAMAKVVLAGGGTILGIAALAIASDLRGLRPPLTNLKSVLAIAIVGLITAGAAGGGPILQSGEAQRAREADAAREAVLAPVYGLAWQIDVRSAASRAAMTSSEFAGRPFETVEIVERLELEITLRSRDDVDIADSIAVCLGSELSRRPDKEPPVDPCWGGPALTAAINALFDRSSGGRLRVGAGEIRTASVVLTRLNSACDYPGGPWFLEIEVAPAGYDGTIGLFKSTPGLSFEVVPVAASGPAVVAPNYCVSGD